MPTVPLFSTGISGKSKFVSAQNRINLFVEQTVDGDKYQTAYYSRPGLVRLNPTVVASGGNAPGPTGPALGKLVMLPNDGTGVPQPEVLWIARSGGWEVWSSSTDIATWGGSGTDVVPNNRYVSMAYGGPTNRGFAVDGVNAWWIAPKPPPTGATVVPATGAGGTGGFPWTGARSVCYLASRLIVDCPAFPGRFAWSPLNFAIGTVWNGLDYATAESAPDALVCVTAHRGELILWGTSTIEFWAPSAQTTFTNIQGSTAPWSLIAQQSIAVVGEHCYFLGRSLNGKAQVCVLNGYKPQVISTPEIDYWLNPTLDFSQTEASAFSILGHEFYVLNITSIFPLTFVYDVTTQSWSYWQTDANRWAGKMVVEFLGSLLVSDYRDSREYLLTSDVYRDDAGTTFLREITSKHVFSELDRITVQEMILDIETGVDTIANSGRWLVLNSAPNTTKSISSAVGVTTASFTVEFWALFNFGFLSPEFLIIKNNVGGGSWRIFRNGMFSLEFDAYPGDVGNLLLSGFTLGVPFHAAFTYNSVSGGLTSYLNGAPNNTVAGVASMFGATAVTGMDFGNVGGTNCANGNLGSIRIWNGVRTQADIAANMTTRMPVGTANLVNQWWEFPSGGTVFTSSGTNPAVIVLGGSTTTGANPVLAVPDRAPQVMLQVSKDSGRTFGYELWNGFGKTGEYRTLVRWTRLGRARDMVFKFRVTDPVKVTLQGASARINRHGDDGG